MISRKYVVENPSGLHVRPAGLLVKAAESCSSKIEIIYKYNIINARSLLNILAASIAQGSEIEIQCSGAEEEQDMAKILDTLQHLED